MRRVFELYVAVNGYRFIANQVNYEGHRWKKGQPFSISTVKTILENPICIEMTHYDVRRNWTDKRRGNMNLNPVF